MDNSSQVLYQQPQSVVPGEERPLLSIVIPCYNESARVRIMLDGLAEFEERWERRFEAIIPGNDSNDDTTEVITSDNDNGDNTADAIAAEESNNDLPEIVVIDEAKDDTSVIEAGNGSEADLVQSDDESAGEAIVPESLAGLEEKQKRTYEVIIIDDGSKDDTAQKIQQAIDADYTFLKDKVRIEKMPANGGKGSALKKGVGLAKGDYVLTLDADMSTRPIEFINWEQKEKDLFNSDNTIYIGSRRHKEGKVEALKSRRIIGSIFNSIVQIFTTLSLKDTQCGFKLYPHKVARFLFGNLQSKGWAHDVELLYQASLNDIQIREMPVTWVNQRESKVNVVKDSVIMFLDVLIISLRIWLYNAFILPFRIPADTDPGLKKQIIYRSVFNMLAVLLVIVMPLMSFQYAITGDEHWHFDYGNSIYNYFFHGDHDAQTTDTGIQYYGGIFDFLTAFVYNVFHFWDHYSTMHFINAIVGAIGIIYAGKLARFFGGWNTGLLTMVFLILSPSWFGHNFANPKDIPFSVGYTAGLYFIILFLKSLPNPTAKHLVGLICSIGWAMGVRIGGLLLIAYLGLFILVYVIYTRQFRAVMNMRVLGQFILTIVGGYFIAILFWPYAHLGIISKPFEALGVMSNFFVTIGMIYDGTRMMSDHIPWYYIPRYIAYTAPIIVLAGIIISILGLPEIFRKNKNLLLLSFFILFTCLFPVVYAIYKKSSLYDGWRHFLFIYPPLAVLASIGWMAFINSSNRIVRYFTIAIIVIGLISPLKFMAANHTYESLYYNEIIGGLKGVYGKFETDYYMLGIREATEWLIKNKHLASEKTVVGTNCIYPVLGYLYQSHYKNLSGKYDRIYERYADFRHCPEYEYYSRKYPDFKDNFPSNGVYVRGDEVYEKDWDYCILFSRFVDVTQLKTGNWPPQKPIYTVKVDGVPIAFVLKRITKKDFAGFELMKQDKFNEAKATFFESLKEFPDNENVWQALAQMYESDGETDSVIYAGRHILMRDPADINTYEMMGLAFLKLHHADSAVKLYRSLELYSPSYSHYLMAFVYAATQNDEAALNEIDIAIEIDPYNELAYKLGMKIAQDMMDDSKSKEYGEKGKKALEEKEGGSRDDTEDASTQGN